MKKMVYYLILGIFIPPILKAQDVVIQESRQIPVVDTADVIVTGGGISGVAAALKAADMGFSVILIEKRNHFGYELTATKKASNPKTNKIKDAPLTQKMLEYLEDSGIYKKGFIDPENLKLALNKKVIESRNIKTYLYSRIATAIVEDNKIKGVSIVNHSGRQAVLGKIVIDATKTGKTARLAGEKQQKTEGTQQIKTFIRVVHHNQPQTQKLSCTIKNQTVQLDIFQLPGSADFFIQTSFPVNVPEQTLHENSYLQSYANEINYYVIEYLQKNIPGFQELEPDKPYYRKGNHWTYYPGDEYFLSEIPEIETKKQFATKEIQQFKINSSGGFKTRHIENLWLTGRIINGNEDIAGFKQLFYLGEKAAKFAVENIRQQEINIPQHKGKFDTEFIGGNIICELLSGSDLHKQYPLLKEKEQHIPVIKKVDVLVAGAGASGAPAAISAAQSGAKVAVIENLTFPGGMGTNGIYGYYWGLHFDHENKRMTRHSTLRKKVDSESVIDSSYITFSPQRRKFVWQDNFQQNRVEIFYNSFASGVYMQGNKVKGLLIDNDMGRQLILADVVIDATSVGSIALMAGADFSYGRSTDGFMIPMTILVNMVNRDNGFRDNSNVTDLTDITMKALSELDSAKYISPLAGTRETRHIKGDYALNYEDVLALRRFPDVVCKYYTLFDSHERDDAAFTTFLQDWHAVMGLFRMPFEGQIPYRSLLPAGVDNLLVIGESFSIEHNALTGIRMQGDLFYMGEAAGTAAALAALNQISPRELKIRKLQNKLIEAKVIAKEDLVPAIEYIDAEFVEKYIQKLGTPDEALAMGKLYSAGQKAIPQLNELLASKDAILRYKAALLLGMQKQQEAIPVLLECIKEKNDYKLFYILKGHSYRYGQPFYVCAAMLAGRMQSEQAVEPVAALLKDTISHTPDQMAIFIKSLQQIGNPSVLRDIRPFLDFYDKQASEAYQPALQWGVRFAAIEAMLEMGDFSPVPVLISYLDNDKYLLRKYAYRLLTKYTGRQYESNTVKWQKWWKENKSTYLK